MSWPQRLNLTVHDWSTDVLLLNPIKGAPGTRGTEQSPVRYSDTIGPSYLYGRFNHTFPAEPLYFAQIAGQLRASGIRCEIADGLCHQFDIDDMAQVVSMFDTDIIAIAVFHNTLSEALELATSVKKNRPGSTIVFGSAYAAPRWREILEHDVVDYVVVGDGELAFAQLVVSLLGRYDVCAEIPGVAGRDRSGAARLTPPKPIHDLDSLPFAARDLLPLVREQGHGVSVYSTRGCAFGRCSFCYLLPYQEVSLQPRWRARSASNVVDELERLVMSHDVRRFTFVDEDYFGTNEAGVQRAIDIANEILNRSLSISYYVNALVKSLLFVIRSGHLPLLSQSGLDSVFTGFESTSPARLKSFHKPQKPDQYGHVIDELDKYGVRINPGLITFTPDAELDDIVANVQLARRMHYYDLYLFTRRLVDLDTAPAATRAAAVRRHAQGTSWLESYRKEHAELLNHFENPRVAALYQLMRIICSRLVDAYQIGGVYSRARLVQLREHLISKHFEAFDQAVGYCSSSTAVPADFDALLVVSDGLAQGILSAAEPAVLTVGGWS
jgi:hypothetical protein